MGTTFLIHLFEDVMILVQEGGNENKNFGLLQEEEEGAVVK